MFMGISKKKNVHSEGDKYCDECGAVTAPYSGNLCDDCYDPYEDEDCYR